ncbi:MAG: CBS domain-containing protein [Deltaproteobacteria bacterium]|nr:CBS domain-containing protein [Deltaproteobacteria bacterium]
MRVRDILEEKGSKVLTARVEDTLLQAARHLVDEGVGVLVVVDERGRPVGMLSERDIIRAFTLQPNEIVRIQVGEVMTREVVFTSPAEGLKAVQETMTERRVRHLPVAEDGRLLGLVSIGDVLRALHREGEIENHDLKNYISGKYLE